MSWNENIFIALGSNIGDRLGYLGKAVLILGQHPKITPIQYSSIYETDPVGYLDQDRFYNMVIEIATELSPLELMQTLLDIELRLGRERRIQYGPRTIDLDLLLYGDLCIELPELILPHPRLHERSFVLVPLGEIAPDAVHPKERKKIGELLQHISIEGITRLNL